MKLIQKQFLKGSREYEIVDDVINVCMKSAFKEEKLSILLSMLDPEPVVNKPNLDFHSRVKCGPLLSLLIDKPDHDTFNRFVDQLKSKAREEYNAFAGLKSGSQAEGPGGNVYSEPPDFDTPNNSKTNKKRKPVNVANIDSAIKMLGQHVDTSEIGPLLTALEKLRSEPENESIFSELVTAFDGLGPQQGAVLTYAPYVSILLAEETLGY